jgi:hypothetical protein
MSLPKAGDLERELAEKVRAAAGSGSRAMTATIVLAAEPGRIPSAEALVDTLTGRRPVRVLHLRGGAAVSAAWASARCAVDRGSRGVCFEDAYWETPDVSPGVRHWSGLLLRELPALLVWARPAAALAPEADELADAIDLAVLDGDAEAAAAGRSADPGAYAGVLSALAERGPALVDLAWERGENFRVAVARLFDGILGERPWSDLAGIELCAPTAWTARLHSGWLRSRLADRLPAGLLERRVADDCAAAPGAASAHFRFKDGARASVGFEKPGTARLEFPDGRTRELGFAPTEDGAILARLVDAPLADPLFAAALAALA